FVIGVMAGRLFLLTGGFRRQTSTMVFLTSTLVLLGFLFFGHHVPYILINSGLLAPLLTVVLASLASGGPTANFFKHRWFIALGQSSFCLYMLHVPLWNLVYADSAPYWKLGILFLLIPVSVALYEWVEKPATTALRNLLVPAYKPIAL